MTIRTDTTGRTGDDQKRACRRGEIRQSTEQGNLSGTGEGEWRRTKKMKNKREEMKCMTNKNFYSTAVVGRRF